MKTDKLDADTQKPAAAKTGTKALRRKNTATHISKTIADFQERKEKISISAIAKSTGVTPALIHNTYPDLAEKIRGLVGKSTRSQRDAKHDDLMREKETNRTLREELAQLRMDFAKLASNNQVLIGEISALKAVASGKVVPIFQSTLVHEASPKEEKNDN